MIELCVIRRVFGEVSPEILKSRVLKTREYSEPTFHMNFERVVFPHFATALHINSRCCESAQACARMLIAIGKLQYRPRTEVIADFDIILGVAGAFSIRHC